MKNRNPGPAEETLSVTPCIIYEKNSLSFPIDLELASKFALTEYSRKTHELLNSKYIFFSKALWPITCIQTDPQNYIAIDNLNIFSLAFKITNAPNSAKIGRLLRDGSPNRAEYPEILEKVSNIVDKRSQEEIQVRGVIDPEVLSGLATLIKLSDNQSPSYMAKLEPVFNTDDIFKIADSFKNAVIKLEGNIINWEQLKDLVISISDLWIGEINKEYTDEEKKLQTTLTRSKKDLHDKSVDYDVKKSNEHYELREWQIKQNKNIAKKIIEKYQPINQNFEKFLIESKKLKIVFGEETDPEDILSITLNLIKDLEKNLPAMKNLITKTKNEVENIRNDIDGLAAKIREKELEIENKYKNMVDGAQGEIEQIQEQKTKDFSELKDIKDRVEEKSTILINKIEKVIEICKNEKSYLSQWSVPGNSLGIVMPINKIWVPLYVAEVETTEGEEKFIVTPPSVLPSQFSTSERWIPFEFLHNSFKVMLKERLEKSLEINLELRSNFEFNCSKSNLLSIPDIDKKISRGLNEILRKNLIEEKYVNEIQENWSNSIIK